MLLNKYRRFEFVNIINGPYNINFALKQKHINSLWIAKISRDLSFQHIDFTDLNERALLAYRLGKIVKTCIPRTIFIDFNQIGYSPLFNEFMNSVRKNGINVPPKLLLTQFRGITLSNFLKLSKIDKIKNLHQVLHNFLFNLWIGNYDKKDEDYVVDNNCICYSIDYNLCGPGFRTKDELSLGAFAEAYDINDVNDTGWAISESLINVIKSNRYDVSFFDSAIKEIEGVQDKEIKDAFKDLNFFKQTSHDNLNDVFQKFIFDRRKKLRDVINTWLNNGCPRSHRPKNNGIR